MNIQIQVQAELVKSKTVKIIILFFFLFVLGGMLQWDVSTFQSCIVYFIDY